MVDAEPRTSLYWGDRQWLDMNMRQTRHFKDPPAFLKRYGFAFGWIATHGYEPVRKELDSLRPRPISFTPSSNGRGNDWVLVVDDEARKFPVPGSTEVVRQLGTGR
jgi:hypothetical protein